MTWSCPWPSRGPGRHGPGHNVYTYHRNPDDQIVEMFTELDKMLDESLGYFEPKGGDLTPSYQIDFRLYENGVSRELLIDYGDFSIHGTLTALEYLKPAECH